mmetsp:Transcript_48052/g.150801  ORF Transcript_48052/g.150801 Transcript_48052/m.150801 type:complete len:252 (-) Transcript_48052:173-928(-)
MLEVGGCLPVLRLLHLLWTNRHHAPPLAPLLGSLGSEGRAFCSPGPPSGWSASAMARVCHGLLHPPLRLLLDIVVLEIPGQHNLLEGLCPHFVVLRSQHSVVYNVVLEVVRSLLDVHVRVLRPRHERFPQSFVGARVEIVPPDHKLVPPLASLELLLLPCIHLLLLRLLDERQTARHIVGLLLGVVDAEQALLLLLPAHWDGSRCELVRTSERLVEHSDVEFAASHLQHLIPEALAVGNQGHWILIHRSHC